MHVLMMLVIGLSFLALSYVAARVLGREGSSRLVARAMGLFCLAWLLASALDFYLGVGQVGYSAGSELAAHAVIFGVPAAAALFLAVRASGHDPARPV